MIYFSLPCQDIRTPISLLSGAPLPIILRPCTALLTNMLDGFEILTTSGVVLWSRSYVPVNTSLVNEFIKAVFIEEKVLPGGAAAVTENDSAAKNLPYKKDQYTLKWASVKELGLIFVVRILFFV